jgi:hypothetical protein
MTHPQYETPFWVLRRRGETFALEKVAEVVSCYYGLRGDDTRYEDLLEELRQQDQELWQRCILEVLNQGIISLNVPIQYLIRVQEPVYLCRCRERLELGALTDWMWEVPIGDATLSVPRGAGTVLLRIKKVVTPASATRRSWRRSTGSGRSLTRCKRIVLLGPVPAAACADER